MNKQEKMDTIYKRRWRLRNPAKAKAQGIIACAISMGKLIKPNQCSKCKSKDIPIEVHHPDYEKPLDIIWVCKKCHRFIHRNKFLAINSVDESRMKIFLEKIFLLRQIFDNYEVLAGLIGTSPATLCKLFNPNPSKTMKLSTFESIEQNTKKLLQKLEGQFAEKSQLKIKAKYAMDKIKEIRERLSKNRPASNEERYVLLAWIIQYQLDAKFLLAEFDRVKEQFGNNKSLKGD